MANVFITQDVLDALTGTVGLPSAVNKYVTETDPALGGGGGTVLPGTTDQLVKYNVTGLNVENAPFLVSGSDLLPAGGNNSGQLGLAGQRFAAVYANDIIAGDMHFARKGEEDEPEVIYWKLREYEDGFHAINVITGKRFKVALIPIPDEDTP